MISGSRLVLREWSESDLVFLQKLRNNVPLQAKLLANARGSDLPKVRTWLLSRKNNNQRIFFLIESKKPQPIGYLQADIVEKKPKTFQLGICIADEFQGIGFGREALKVFERFLCLEREAQKIVLEVDVKNISAINCYLSIGYTKMRVLKQFKNVRNVWKDVLIMEKILPTLNQ